jgi:hypothetical protein
VGRRSIIDWINEDGGFPDDLNKPVFANASRELKLMRNESAQAPRLEIFQVGRKAGAQA